MQKLRYHITTLSPVLLVSSTGDTNMVATREYIPGSAVLGLFAGEFIRKKSPSLNAHTDPTFSQWFLKEGLRFTNAYNAYIVSRDKDNNLKSNCPIPISLQRKKKDEKSIHDLLINECKEQTKGISGFGRIEGKRFFKQAVKKLLNFHHEREPNTGTTKEIFNYESIDSGQTFEGEIIGEENELKKFLELFQAENIFRIGRSKGVQYGKISFEFVSKKPEEITAHVDNINGDISMTLVSDTIFYNPNGFSTTDVTELENELKKTIGNNITIDRAFIKAGETENFVSVWKLRRPSETCFQMGSCFLIKGLSPSDKDKLLELEKNGIGERRGEGFGRVIFGWQKKDTLNEEDNKEPEKKKPSIPLPEKSKIIAQTVIKDFIRKQVEIKALGEVKEFVQEDRKDKGLPSKSLIGRLETTLRQKNKVDFIKFIDELKKPAKDKLLNCHNGFESLFDFLTDNKKGVTADIDIKQIMKNSKELQKFCEEIEFAIEQDTDFSTELFRKYLLVFFSQMRKKLKQEA